MISFLLECSAVITNAGFELVSEALNLGKKLLIKPLAGQMEQSSNAVAIRDLDLGLVMYKLDRKYVEQMLKNPPAVSEKYPYVAAMIAGYIQNGDWDNLDELAKKAWVKTN